MGPAAAPAVVAPPRVPQIDTEAIARRLQDFLQSSDRDIEFRVDADTGTQVVTVRDATTGDIIRQMPGEEVLRAFKNLDLNHGAIFDAVI
ncbi:MAG: flagellar protein FlaG [Steroidobacteraceae bacterium]